MDHTVTHTLPTSVSIACSPNPPLLTPILYNIAYMGLTHTLTPLTMTCTSASHSQCSKVCGSLHGDVAVSIIVGCVAVEYVATHIFLYTHMILLSHVYHQHTDQCVC